MEATCPPILLQMIYMIMAGYFEDDARKPNGLDDWYYQQKCGNNALIPSV